MNGLTQDRIIRVSARRNSVRSTHHVPAGANGISALAERHPSPVARAPEALTRTVEREVIPRLLVVHKPLPVLETRPAPAGLVSQADIVDFTGLVANRELKEALARIAIKRSEGVTLEAVYLDLLIPSARRLSDLWEADMCHYEEIAVGILHLQQVLHELSPAFTIETHCQARGRKALLVSAPEEQSMLGLFMVTEFYRCVSSEFFYRAGWEVWREPPSSRSQLRGILNSQWFDVVDVAASCEARLPALSADLADMRKASRNSHVGVVVDGPVFHDHPEFLSRVGADASASDSRDTLAQAELLMTARER
jgi:hypothetical protein